MIGKGSLPVHRAEAEFGSERKVLEKPARSPLRTCPDVAHSGALAVLAAQRHLRPTDDGILQE